MTLTKKCQVFFIFTALCSTFSSLAIFLNLDLYFHKIEYLGVALSLRTLSSSVFGYIAPKIIRNFGLKRVLVFSQIFAVCILAILGFGFYVNNLYIILLSTVLVGIPFILVTIVVTICFRLASKVEENYRQQSGRRELFFGLARLAGCLLTPLLFVGIDIYTFLLIVSIVYLLSLIVIISGKFPQITVSDTVDDRQITSQIFAQRETLVFILKLVSAWLLIAFIPLIASSSHINLTDNLSTVIRQSLWSIEPTTMVLASSIYILVKQFRQKIAIHFIFIVNGVFLFLLLFSHSGIMVAVVAGLISFMMMLIFYVLRDNYVLVAGDNKELINQHASFAVACRDFICTLSPLYLGYLLTGVSLLSFAILIISVQFLLFIISMVVKSKKPVLL